jgi:hypothetical protein
MIRIATRGSIFLIDEGLNRYQRMPKEEKPREKPEWGSSVAGPLQDFVWHDMDPEGWYIVPQSNRLYIHTAGSFISAPDPKILA